MNTNILLICLVFVSFAGITTCTTKTMQINTLKHKVQITWLDSCFRAVDETCYYADCAVTPIEVIKEKTCELPEDL